MSSSNAPSVLIHNRKASFHYYIDDTWEAGIMLTGTEVKSVREGKVSLVDAYCIFKNDGLWVKNMNISVYTHGGFNNHDPKRERKLLLHAHQLAKIRSKLREKGLTLIPVKMYLSERGFIKVEVGLARGKKLYDKRETLKKAEATRELGRVIKRH